MHTRLHQGGQKMSFWAYTPTPTNGRLGPAAVLVMSLRLLAIVGGIWLVILPGVTVICGAKPTLSERREAKGDDEHDT